MTFQSTHSLRSATSTSKSSLTRLPVSIHALLAECDAGDGIKPFNYDVSIHALLAECDAPQPVRCGIHPVSIHALLAECDLPGVSPCAPGRSFNPRTPCGVRLVALGVILTRNPFQSTHSLRSATAYGLPPLWTCWVSIHALLAECDDAGFNRPDGSRSFNPRTPCGVRPAAMASMGFTRSFQSTHSLRSATRAFVLPKPEFAVSIHALLAECDHWPRGA